MHKMGGFNVQMAIEILIPEKFEIGIVIAIGYQDSHEVLPERLRGKSSSTRERKTLEEIMFFDELTILNNISSLIHNPG
jgi:hypothetical protein